MITGNEGAAIYCKASSVTSTNNVIMNNGFGIYLKTEGPDTSSATVKCNTILSNSDRGLYCEGSTATVTDSIFWGNCGDGDEILIKPKLFFMEPQVPEIQDGELTISYSDVEGGEDGVYLPAVSYSYGPHTYYFYGTLNWLDGNINSDPLFVSGPLHDYYLSQTAAGQAATSPCVNAGSGSAAERQMDQLTTRTDNVTDAGTVDIGYHAPLYALEIDSITRGSDPITIHWNQWPGLSYIVQWSEDLSLWNDIPVGATDTWTDTNTLPYSKKFYRVTRE